MKVLLFGKNAKNIEGLVKDLGFLIVNLEPDVVISYGGDGTLLASERQFPGIPKLPIRDSQVYKKCSNHTDQVLLNSLKGNKLQLKEFRKLETNFLGKTLLALNDFVIRNQSPIHTIRFQILDDKLLIGDGVVVATSFGSTGYFKSVAQQTFSQGFGLAFNNTTETIPPIFFQEKDQVSFKLVRGNASLTYDNNPDIYAVDEGSTVSFKLSDKKALIYQPETLRCPNCKMVRG